MGFVSFVHWAPLLFACGLCLPLSLWISVSLCFKGSDLAPVVITCACSSFILKPTMFSIFKNRTGLRCIHTLLRHRVPHSICPCLIAPHLQRSPVKITFPEIWANTCCSHPLFDLPAETILEVSAPLLPCVDSCVRRFVCMMCI